MSRELTQADAAERVLREAGKPLHYREITERIIASKFDVWGYGSPGKTPENSVYRAITEEVRNSSNARFAYVKGVVQLAHRFVPKVAPPASFAAPESLHDEPLTTGIGHQQAGPTYPDAIRQALREAISSQDSVRFHRLVTEAFDAIGWDWREVQIVPETASAKVTLQLSTGDLERLLALAVLLSRPEENAP